MFSAKLKTKMSFYRLLEIPLMIYLETDWQIRLINKLVFVNALKVAGFGCLVSLQWCTEVFPGYSSLMFIPEF